MTHEPTHGHQAAPPPTFMRAMISRCVMAVIGLALLAGAYQCISLSRQAHGQAQAATMEEGRVPDPQIVRRGAGGGISMVVGIALGAAGLILFGKAILPKAAQQWFVQPRRPQ